MEATKSGYDVVPTRDFLEEARYSTELGSDTDGRDLSDGDRAEKQGWHSSNNTKAQRRKRSTCFTIIRSYWWLVDTTLLVIVIVLLLVVRGQWKNYPETKMQVGGDYTGSGPRFPVKTVKWNSDTSFVPSDPNEFFSNKTKDTWNTLLPTGSGWGNYQERFFTTSMTHQLHCVFMMGRIYSAFKANKSATLPSDYDSHYLHCLDYLRQAIMCAGDVALEAHGPKDPDDNGPLDGSWSGLHVCKDYKQVLSYLEVQIQAGVRKVLPIDD